jgi:hypothetical protein
MSKAAGPAPSGYQGSAVSDARPVTGGRPAADLAPASPAPVRPALARDIRASGAGGAGQPGPESETVRPGNPRPSAARPGASQPSAPAPGAAQPGAPESGPATSGESRPGAPQSGAPQSGAPQSGAPGPAVVRSGVSQPGNPPAGTGRDLEKRPSAVPAAGDYLLPARPATAGVGEPSWAQVIGTTLSLWLHRRVLRDQQVPGQRRPRWGRRAAVLGLVVVVFAAGALTITLVQGRPSSAARHHRAAASKARAVQSSPPSPASLAAAAAGRQAAATWVAAQVGHNVIVSCDPMMCSDLMARGFPAGDLMSLSASATDPMGSQIVVATTALSSQFGSRLADVYAPVVIASFGAGAAQVDVRIEAADGSAAYLVTLRADLLARVTAGQQLLKNKALHVSGASRQAIADGYVDSRLLITLVGLLSEEHQVSISQFGDGGPGTAAAARGEVPLRMVRISGLMSGHGKHEDAYLSSAIKFLQAQQSPFRSVFSVLHLHGKPVIQIQFSAPAPLGLLGAGASP